MRPLMVLALLAAAAHTGDVEDEVQAILQELTSPYPDSRWLALGDLVEYGTSDHEVARRAVLRALYDESWLVRSEAAQTLDALGWLEGEVLQVLIKRCGERGRDTNERLLYLGVIAGSEAGAGKELAAGLMADDTEDPHVRLAAAWVHVQASGDPTVAVQLCGQMLESKNRDVRVTALEVFCWIGQPGARYSATIRKIIESAQDPTEKRLAALALLEMGTQTDVAIKALRELLRPDPSQRNWMTFSRIAHLESPPAALAPELIEALAKGDRNELEKRHTCARFALDALASMGASAKAAAPVLRRIMSWQWPDVSGIGAHAAYAYGEITGDHALAVGVLIEILRAPEVAKASDWLLDPGEGAKEALRMLEKIGRPHAEAAAPTLRELAKTARCRRGRILVRRTLRAIPMDD